MYNIDNKYKLKNGVIMKLKDLISEVKIYQNNFIKINMAEKFIKEIVGEYGSIENMPRLEFDNDGLFILLDTMMYREFDNKLASIPENEKTFFLTGGTVVDDRKNIKKYYIEFMKVEEDDAETKDSNSDDKVV